MLTNARLAFTGGKKILTRVAGKDASKQFWKYHNEGILKKYKKSLQIGSLDSKKQPHVEAAKPSPAAAAPKPTKQAKKAVEEEAEALEPYGDLIPFADPSWYQGVSCPRFMCPQLSMRMHQEAEADLLWNR